MLQAASTWGLLATGILIGLLVCFSPAVPHSEKAEESAGTDHWLWMCHDPCPGNGLEPDAEFWVGLYVSTAGLPFYVWRYHTMAVYGLLGILLSIYRYQDLIWEKSGKGGLQCTGPIGRYRIRIEKWMYDEL